MTVGPTNDMKEMAIAIVTLLRIVARGMATDAARMREHQIDLIPARRPFTRVADGGGGAGVGRRRVVDSAVDIQQ